MTADAPVLVAEALSRGFGDRWALRGVNLRLRAGQSLLLAGHNGAGKTTLLRILAGLLRPTSGTLAILGHDPRRDLFAARRGLALVAHQGHHHLDLPAGENLAVAARLLGLASPDARVADALHRVGLADRADDAVATFSAGMKKRLTFARVLLQDPALVLLDEPWGQLDPAGFRFVDGLLAELTGRGAAVVLATHLVERAGLLLDHGLLLESGTPRWVGPAPELARAMREEGQ